MNLTRGSRPDVAGFPPISQQCPPSCEEQHKTRWQEQPTQKLLQLAQVVRRFVPGTRNKGRLTVIRQEHQTCKQEYGPDDDRRDGEETRTSAPARRGTWRRRNIHADFLVPLTSRTASPATNRMIPNQRTTFPVSLAVMQTDDATSPGIRGRFERHSFVTKGSDTTIEINPKTTIRAPATRDPVLRSSTECGGSVTWDHPPMKAHPPSDVRGPQARTSPRKLRN